MPEDVGGSPFPDGWEPDESHDRGGADDAFASVVFDEDFVRAAEVHEPTAVERLLAAAQAAAEAHRAPARGGGSDDELYDDGYGPDDEGPFGHDRYDADADADDETFGAIDGHGGGYNGPARWHRPVAWLLALLMGIGMVALAFTAVYRGASTGPKERIPPPASTEVEPGAPAHPSASADYSQPAVSAVPRTP